MQSVKVESAEETMRIGKKLATLLSPGDVILLDGDLGAGKTTFTKGLGEGLGIKRSIKSPTFTIIREYSGGRLPLYHMDVYRLEDGSGDELGLDEYFEGDGVSVVEWSQFVEDTLPDDYLKISFQRLDNEADNKRELTFTGTNDRYNQIIDQILGD
ncbi:tRNA (adenosine(37)-N6)-threonylcarbamoyltransferase complex ATPase subunit type 1 TsaE [Lentilactobacillus sp. SPB1-3]|uniref:tRNA (Adenosine(37)-N6)-threonylcarbamoyltransferase complex ATPase subunit type 1 TsaE n=1 Tax=Lentilactobacillus terminaliae TaxID=3003483 RepID=A0ACD5DH68_9LACO|nr:tRNA (adenosine(37)-N6)-threonylcarbamoyltransferase complex ATPase subunit type 1 TsaE [Lentilactobacillus sp. SPB1-3]MCZ0976984.1 tRNA (adenosine(37)-N6)-threonylcarbamoyltransferase complex ATPase subunit type 1 TsaE [Lentilactobacillus sp. SPB1-3]